MDQKQKAILALNSYPNEQKNNFWLSNQDSCSYESSEKDGSLEYNWFYFKNHNIWMCRVYDYEQMKDGDGFLSRIIFTIDKSLKIN